MQVSFEDNEFTRWNLIEYMNKLYGFQLNGSPFTPQLINSWIKTRTIPDSYGGHRILDVKYYVELQNLCVLTIERLSRKDLEIMDVDINEFKTTINHKRAQLKSVKNRKGKVRTDLYYQIAGRKGKNDIEIPTNFKDYGIKTTQVKQKSRKKEL